jgi:hypothetical protein
MEADPRQEFTVPSGLHSGSGTIPARPSIAKFLVKEWGALRAGLQQQWITALSPSRGALKGYRAIGCEAAVEVCDGAAVVEQTKGPERRRRGSEGGRRRAAAELERIEADPAAQIVRYKSLGRPVRPSLRRAVWLSSVCLSQPSSQSPPPSLSLSCHVKLPAA